MGTANTDGKSSLDSKFEPLQTFMEAGKGNHTSLLSNFEWNPIAAGDRPLPEADDITPWFQNRGGDADSGTQGRPLSRRMTESLTDETFQDQYKRAFEGNVPQIFIPMRFRLPDFPFKKVQQRQVEVPDGTCSPSKTEEKNEEKNSVVSKLCMSIQIRTEITGLNCCLKTVELDEGLSLYLPTTLLDDEFKTQLEDEIVRLVPHYADFERYFEVHDGRSAPPIVDEEKWIIQKRYSRLCTRYKAKRQLLGHSLRRTWKETMVNSTNKPSSTISELAAFRRSRPDWRSYVLFVRTFAHRYDFLPNLLAGPLKALPPHATKNNLTSMANELTKGRKDENSDQREWPKPLLTQYKTLRMQKRIAKRKAELAELEAEDNPEPQAKTPVKQAEKPAAVVQRYAPMTFRQKLKEGRRALKERKIAAEKAGKETAKVNVKDQRGTNPEDTLKCSVDNGRTKRQDARQKRREARLLCQQNAAALRNQTTNPFRIPVRGIGQLFLSDVDPTPARTQYTQEQMNEAREGDGLAGQRNKREGKAQPSPGFGIENGEEPFQRFSRFPDDGAADDAEEDSWTEDDLWQDDPDENLTGNSGDIDDDDDELQNGHGKMLNQHGKNVVATSRSYGNNIEGSESPSPGETPEQISGYDRWKKTRENSEKTPPKREAVWRKRTKTKETKNFHRMLSQTSDRDPTYRALRREGLRTPDGVPRSGTEDEEEFIETEQPKDFKSAKVTTDTAGTRSLSTGKSPVRRVEASSNPSPHGSRNRPDTSVWEFEAEDPHHATNEGTITQNEQRVQSTDTRKAKELQPDDRRFLLSTRTRHIVNNENTLQGQEKITIQRTDFKQGKARGVAYQRTLNAISIIPEIQSSMLSAVAPSFASFESSNNSSRPNSPQFETRGGGIASAKPHPVSEISMQDDFHGSPSALNICHRCHKPKTTKDRHMRNIPQFRNRGWRSFKRPMTEDNTVTFVDLPPVASVPPNCSADNVVGVEGLIDLPARPELKVSTNEDGKAKSFKPSVLDTVKKLDKAILKSGRYHRHSHKSHSPISNDIPWTVQPRKKEEISMECYCCPPHQTGTEEDFLERQKHLENIHPRYYHAHPKPIQKPKSPPRTQKTSIKVRGLLKESRSTGQLQVPKLHKVVSAAMKHHTHFTKSNTNVITHQKAEYGTGVSHQVPETHHNDPHKIHRDRGSQNMARFMQRWKQLRDFVHARPS